MKSALAESVAKAVTGTLGVCEDAVSIAIEDIEPRDWPDEVYARVGSEMELALL
jgi:phenylpyruvate tautomerase PptA (4-oxalocrotonate tautomerase family)